MIALVIGYGSIGKKHCKILQEIKKINKIFILTKQKISKDFYLCENFSSIKKINPDYIIISSNTNKHYSTLKYLNNNLKNKIILVEKPLFEKYYDFPKLNNKVFIDYNLRLHPVIAKIKKLVKKRKIFSVNSLCLSDLRNWRKGRKYNKTSSAKKSDGGGVILDLSHEFDFISWIFGQMSLIKSIDKKLSNLKINTEDYLSLIAKTRSNIFIQINLNYYSLSNVRKIYIDGKNFSIRGDLMKNILDYKTNKKNKTFKFKNFNILQTYKNMHKLLLSKNYKDICSFKEGIKNLKFINQLKKFS